MNNNTSKRVRLVAITTFALGAGFAIWDALLWLNPDKTRTANYVLNIYYALFYILASYLCFSASRRLRNTNDKNATQGLLFWGIALAAWAVGLLIWSYYNLVAKIDIPFPSLADIGFLIFLPVMALGTWKIQGVYQSENKQPLIAGLPLIIVSMVLVLFVFNRPDLSTDLPMLARFINFAYSLGDGILLSMTLVALQGNARAGTKRHFYILILGLMMLTVGDFTFYYSTAHETYWNGYIPDIFFAAFPLIFANGITRAEYYLSQRSNPEGDTMTQNSVESLAPVTAVQPAALQPQVPTTTEPPTNPPVTLSQ